MDQKDLQTFKHWFAEYVSSFSTSVQEDQQNIDLKNDHTVEVCRNAVRIARDLKLSEGDMLLAEAIALFHDIGRFPQYQQYKTFKDSISVNHATLGAKVLLEKGVLEILPGYEKDIIIKSITLHNVFSLPEGLDDTTLLFSKLVRDADKLDIWRVMVEYYGQAQEQWPSALVLGLSNGPGYSPEILGAVRGGGVARLSNIRTLNDFKLIQLAWIFDLNFAGSFRMVQERKYIDKLAEYLPATREISEAVSVVRAHVERKLE
jgi:putative nucleotidyltransferase with HDIG domain